MTRYAHHSGGLRPAGRAVGLAIALGLCLSGLSDPPAARPATPTGETSPLSFSVREGRQINAFYRQGPVAAHIVLDSGRMPRLIVAFPAGNSGVGLWFDDQDSAAVWGSAEKVEPVSRKAEGGGQLHGVTAELSIDASSLTVRRSVLGSVRVLRNYQDTGKVPEAVVTTAEVDGSTVTWRRKRLDGAPGYLLSAEALNATVARGEVTFKKTSEGPLRLRITALTGDPPLTPADAIFTAGAANDERARNTLAFLSYEEKLLAGSWRFNTYFGRDTLMSLRLLMPVLTPTVVEAGLGSVLDRLNNKGEVAHEEDIGEFAILRRRTEGGADAGGAGQASAPIFDYKMIDDDFMLAPVAADYLLDTPATRAEAFLNRTTPAGETYRDALLRNFHFVLDQAAPFAERPGVEHLIALHPGENVGEWRDSKDGLGGGTIPYNINAVFVPAALQAIAQLADSGLLDPKKVQAAGLDRAAWMAEVWMKEAPRVFTVRVAPEATRTAVRAYASSVGVDPAPALASLPQEPLRFNALSLNASGETVRVLNSDDGFALLFLNPLREEVELSVRAMMRPFPAGLLTSVGLLVANAAFADPSLQPLFSNQQYHGAVIWSWQQAVLAAGLARQLQRTDLPPTTRDLLRDAQVRLWKTIKAGREVQSSELWSWSFAEGQYRVEPFGQRGGDQTESNAAQLWSTVFLAVTPPHCMQLSCAPPLP
jgi:hypothetical protein